VVRCLLEDREGNLWIGANGGLSRWRSDIFTVYGNAAETAERINLVIVPNSVPAVVAVFGVAAAGGTSSPSTLAAGEDAKLIAAAGIIPSARRNIVQLLFMASP
jgi:hypothetical protein